MNIKQVRRGLFHTLFIGLALLMTGCAATKFTVDDGSPVDEKLLSDIRTYDRAEKLIRPTIKQTTSRQFEDCSTDYDLPFGVASSDELPHMEKIAWARGAGVDERVTVISVVPGSELAVGDHLVSIGEYRDNDADDMLERLEDLRDGGRPFEVITDTGKTVIITPMEVCRGLFAIAPPAKPEAQSYHWLKAEHPLSVFSQEVTPDEVMWMVLWTQGLSEEAGMRMKFYDYGLSFVKTAVTVASIASGVGAVANAAQAAAASVAASEATKQAASAVASQIGKVAAEQAANIVRDKVLAAVKEVAKAQAQEIALNTMKASAMFKSSLSGISWVASTGFYMADKWAFDRMKVMGADPMAAFTLHFKLASHGLADSAFIFDEERAKLMLGFADANGFGQMAKFAMGGDTTTTADGDSIKMAKDMEVRELGAYTGNAVAEVEDIKPTIAETDVIQPAIAITSVDDKQIAIADAGVLKPAVIQVAAPPADVTDVVAKP